MFIYRKLQNKLNTLDIYIILNLDILDTYINVYLFIYEALTFARIFTNIETSEAYKYMFQEVVATVEYDTNERFKFNHIDGEGLGCIIADAHPGQAIGKLFYNNYLLVIYVIIIFL